MGIADNARYCLLLGVICGVCSLSALLTRRMHCTSLTRLNAPSCCDEPTATYCFSELRWSSGCYDGIALHERRPYYRLRSLREAQTWQEESYDSFTPASRGSIPMRLCYRGWPYFSYAGRPKQIRVSLTIRYFMVPGGRQDRSHCGPRNVRLASQSRVGDRLGAMLIIIYVSAMHETRRRRYILHSGGHIQFTLIHARISVIKTSQSACCFRQTFFRVLCKLETLSP